MSKSFSIGVDRFAGVGLGMPGPLELPEGILRNPPNPPRFPCASWFWCKYTMWGTVSRWATLGLCSEHCIPDLRRSLVFDA
jgi:hypothetical protein